MKSEKIIAGATLGILSSAIYIYTTYKAYRFFYEYSHLRNMWLVLGVIGIMLCGVGAIWFLFYEYNYFRSLRTKNKTEAQKTPKDEEKKTIVIEEETVKKKEKKTIVIEESLQRKKDKKIQKKYQEILIEYKKTMPVREYKKFEEDTRYDILLYDALMVSRDKEGKLLSKLESEKGELYITTLKKILE
ncbi:hypothetical protein KA050_02195 [Candidatus Gracilibacteria bacterium]|nr:hypothetical protein [Candidatus Gracilibacteria bacterium]